MVDHLDATFSALSDPTRRAMLAELTLGERSIGDLAAPLDMSLAGASKHVQVLERAGLISRKKVGRQQICRLESSRLRDAHSWLARYRTFWTNALDALEHGLLEEKNDDH